MSIGDPQDMLARLKAGISKGWFPDVAPVRDALFSGFAYALSWAFNLIAYAKLQTRIKSATDGFLDLVGFDYFGLTLLRRPSESDPQYLARILLNLLREKATRNGIVKALTDLTGNIPWVFEPWRPLDCGAYGQNIFGYGIAGGYGSLACPYQGFIVGYRPVGQGIANVAGYCSPEGAYGTGSQIEYANPSQIAGAVTDDDMYAAVADAKVEGTLAWMRISNPPVPVTDELMKEDLSGGFALEDGSGVLTME
ncbi:MAG: hypothetical protein WAL34_04065 [Acidobacteriaceae bacterium]